MNMSLDAILKIVREFVERKRGKSVQTIGASTALLRDGYLDSFALVELIADLEKHLNTRLEDGALIPEDFETPETLYNRLQEL